MTKRKDISKDLFTPERPVSHRNQKVAEEIRHILSEVLARGDLARASLIHPVTITVVKIGSDLRRATVYVMPLGGLKCEEVLAQLNLEIGFFRHELGRSLRLKFVPEISFELDRQFEYAEKIDELLKK